MKKTVRFLLITLATLLVAAAIPFAASADPVPADNIGSLTKLLDVPNLETVISEGTYTFTSSGLNPNKATKRDGNFVYANVTTASGDCWYGYVGETNIPLANDSHYVITYTAQYFQPISMMGFTFLRFNNPDKGPAIRDQALSVFFDQRPANAFGYIYLESNWAGYNAATGVKYADADIEYADLFEENDYVISVEGTTITVYMNHEYLGQFSCANWMKYSPKLALGTCLLSRAGGTLGDQIATIKNMKVYDGTYELYKTVTFEQNGTPVDSSVHTVGTTVGSFPAISVASDEVAVWCIKNTKTVVDASYKVMKDITLEATVFKKSASEVYGIQVTSPSNSEQGVRFISVIQSLEGEQAGFEVIAKYKEDDAYPVVTSAPFELKTNYVYSSITANAAGLVSTISATNIGGNYIMALAVDNVPAELRIDFLVRSYVVFDGNKVYSDTVVFKLNDGEVNNELVALS